MSWPRRRLSEIASIQGGIQKQPKRAPRENKYPFLRVANVTKSGLDLCEVHDIELFDGEFGRYGLQTGDLLVVEGNGSSSQIGRAAIWNGSIPNAVHQNHLIRVRPGSEIDARYLGFLWNSPAVRDELSAVSSSTSGLHTLSVAKLKRIVLPVPGLDEQLRVVEILEDQLSRLDAAADYASAAQQRATTMVSSARQRAVAGATQRAPMHTLGELATVGTGTTPKRSEPRYYEGGVIPWITSGDLAQGDILEANQFVTDAALAETSLKMYPVGTLLIAMYGEGKTRGTVAELGVPATTNQACAAVQIHDETLRPWVRFVLEANYAAMRRLAAGGVQPNLNLSLVRAIQMPVPDAADRERLIASTAAAFEGAASIQRELRSLARRVPTLRKAVLAAAFSGKLTGRHTDDEVIEEAAADLEGAMA